MARQRNIFVQDSSTLYVYDPVSGTFFLLGQTGVTLTDIASVDANRLFGVSFSDLYSVNPDNGQTSRIASLGRTDINGLGVDSNGQLYASGNFTRTLFKLNSQTGQLTPFASATANSAGDIVILNDRLWVATTANTLESFSLVDGTPISVLNHGIRDVFGLAVSPEGELYGFADDKAYVFDLGTGEASLRAIFPIGQQVFGASQAAETPEKIFSGTSVGEFVSGSNTDDVIAGLAGNDQLEGMAGDDYLIGGAGNDTIDGGTGVDFVSYEGLNRSDVSLVKTAGGFMASSTSTGADVLLNVERILFADKGLALDLFGNAGITAKLIAAVFGKESLANQEFVRIGLQELDRGGSYLDLALLAIDARLGTNADNATIVRTLYTNVAGFGPSQQDLEAFVTLLEDGTFNKASLTRFAAEHEVNVLGIDLVGLAQTGIEFSIV